MTPKRILMVFHDAGGAAAAAALIPELQSRYQCRILAFDTAAMVLPKNDIEPYTNASYESAIEFLKSEKPDILITGTSTLAQTIDRAFILAAKSLKIPTLGILDYWCNYKARFMAEADETLACLPDKISVMNKDAEQEMIQDGIPENHIVITGSSRFEALEKKEYDQSKDKETIAQQYKIETEKPWVLFLSQAYAATFGGTDKTREEIGYTEQDSIECLIDAIKKHDIELLARLHPREDKNNRRLFDSVPCTFVQEADINMLISACDVVIGMSTVALVDAYLMRKPVISIQPGQKNEDLCYLTRWNIIPKCETSKAVSTALYEALNQDTFIDFDKAGLSFENSTARILTLISEMLTENAA